MSDKPAPKGTPGTAWNDPKVPGLRLRYLSTKAVYYLFYRTKTGKQRNMPLGDERVLTLTKARELARDILQRVAKGEDPAGERNRLESRPTMQNLRDKHVAYSEERNKPSWADDVKRYWDLHALPHFKAKTAVADVTEEDVQGLFEKFGTRRAAANRCMSMLHKAFNLAEKWKMRPRHTNPVHVERHPETKRKRVMTAEEAVRLLKAMDEMRADQPFFVALVELLLFTGARLTEIMHAEWEWVRTDGLHLPDSKTGEKIVPLSELAREVLRDLPSVQGNPYIIVGRIHGRHMVNPSKLWAELLQRAKIKERLTRHDLRRFFASAGLSGAGLTLDQIGGLLGHMSASTTKRYAFLLTGAAQTQADAAAEAVRHMMTGGGKVIHLKTG